MNGCRLLTQNLLPKKKLLSSKHLASLSNLPFNIPEPIERSPTDLLEALSGTVGVDVTASHFSFIDDPVTIPTSLNKKKHYFLCKEFGKRAARQLAEEWPTLFMFDRDQPRLPVYRPEKPLDPLVVTANEENLLKTITSKHVEDAIKIYLRITEEKIDLSEKTLVKLFNLVCYYNGKNVPIAELEEWHGLRNFYEGDVPENKCSKNSIVELLFKKIENKSAEIYSAMICNLCKFKADANSLKQAKILYLKMIKNGLIPAEEVFNFFLYFCVSTNEADNHFHIPNELKEMERLGVSPSFRTFNSALFASLKISDNHKSWELAKGLVAEMEACKIQPTLTTYDFLLALASKKTQQLSFSIGLLDKILQILESVEIIELRDVSDSNFFFTAIELAAKASNINLIDRIEKIYTCKKNKVNFGSFTKEADFYGIFLINKFFNLSIEDFESVYVAHIPRIASLNVHLASRIFRKLERHPKWSFTKRMIEDCIAIGHATHQHMVNDWQRIMLNFPVEKLSEMELNEYRELVQRLIEIWRELNNLSEERDARQMERNSTRDAQKLETNFEQKKGRRTPIPIINYVFFNEEMIRRGHLKSIN